MKSVRFIDVDGVGPTLARIDEVIQKGHLEDFSELLSVLMADPNGAEAKLVEQLFHSINFDDPEFCAREQLLAVYHLVLALRQYEPHFRQTRK